MVVNHVEYDCEIALVAGVHQPLQALCSAVGALGRVWVNSVIAPVTAPGELSNGHQLDGRDPQLDQLIQAVDGALEGPFPGKRADVQLIEDVRA